MDLSISQLRELICNGEPCGPKTSGASHSLVVGKCYFIRTVTMYYVGRLTAVTDSDIVLADASWIPDTGRFSDFMKSGTPNEAEPFFGDAIVFRGGMIDAREWPHKLPSERK